MQKYPNTVIFTKSTDCGKGYLVLELLKTEYNEQFNYIITVCQTN